jgi:hypothetical protein
MTEHSKLRLLVLTFTPIMSEPRALKQIWRLKDEYQLTTAGFGPAPVDGVSHIELDANPANNGLLRLPGGYPLLLALRQHRYLASHMPKPADAYKRLSGHEWDIIIAHDVPTIALANRLQPRLGVLSDLHEYAPRQNEHSFLWRQLIAPHFRWLIRNEVSQAKEVTTVSQGIVDEYQREFGLSTELVINATPFREAAPSATEEPIRLVHSGIPGRQRKLDVMIEGVRASSADITLDLFLMPTDPEHLEELRRIAGDDPRITFRDPVPYLQLVDKLAEYDLGISLIPPTTFNLEWCLPNKFFDFIQARLGVITGPSPEMVRFVNQYQLGAITEDFSPQAFTRVLDSLTPEQVRAWKNASNNAAEEVSAEQQVEVWANAVARIAAAKSPADS